MFTQKISMDCTKKQYEKYLKNELLKMGYKEDWLLCWNRQENQFIKVDGENVGTVHKHNIREDRTYLGSFNAPLFLALAAMTDKAEGNYGEYIIGLYTGRFYQMNEKDKILPKHRMIRKATKGEIMAKFGDVKISEKIEYPLDFTYKTDDESYVCITEAEMISHLKSKGYKILKPTTWEEV